MFFCVLPGCETWIVRCFRWSFGTRRTVPPEFVRAGRSWFRPIYMARCVNRAGSNCRGRSLQFVPRREAAVLISGWAFCTSILNCSWNQCPASGEFGSAPVGLLPASGAT
ncbi:hypothetical protein SAMN04487819_10643 [Actinopolyspora alba]|uniref:Uncharacterized protein n=1 Tax=Actinopolyspora alba TaxID=673379 RepID=A0A1I1WX26_9ACTN|nr:hypothetical protein SAMN04487819_10643 [Actinopolyspora alba]